MLVDGDCVDVVVDGADVDALMTAPVLVTVDAVTAGTDVGLGVAGAGTGLALLTVPIRYALVVFEPESEEGLKITGY